MRNRPRPSAPLAESGAGVEGGRMVRPPRQRRRIELVPTFRGRRSRVSQCMERGQRRKGTEILVGVIGVLTARRSPAPFDRRDVVWCGKLESRFSWYSSSIGAVRRTPVLAVRGRVRGAAAIACPFRARAGDDTAGCGRTLRRSALGSPGWPLACVASSNPSAVRSSPLGSRGRYGCAITERCRAT